MFTLCRGNPVVRNRVFYGIIGLGLAHGTYMIARSADT